MLADLEELGIDVDDNINAWLAGEAGQREELCELLPDVAPSVSAFTRCDWQKHYPAMGGRVIYEGIEAREIREVCDMLNIAADQRLQVLDDVRLMVRIVLPELNRD